MNVPVMRRTTVTLMPCAPTLKDSMSADAFEVMRVMAETAQVLIIFRVKLHSGLYLLCLFSALCVFVELVSKETERIRRRKKDGDWYIYP